jgi:hypothetical protein
MNDGRLAETMDIFSRREACELGRASEDVLIGFVDSHDVDEMRGEKGYDSTWGQSELRRRAYEQFHE